MARGNARRASFPGGRRRRSWLPDTEAQEQFGGLKSYPYWAAHNNPAGWRPHDDAQAIAYCDGVIDLVGAFFNVPTLELRRTGRTALAVAQVRQIAMYVAHVSLRLTMKQVGTGFQRDRTTVLHACHVVEDMRDDIEFDRLVAHVERIVAAAFMMRCGA